MLHRTLEYGIYLVDFGFLYPVKQGHYLCGKTSQIFLKHNLVVHYIKDEGLFIYLLYLYIQSDVYKKKTENRSKYKFCILNNSFA